MQNNKYVFQRLLFQKLNGQKNHTLRNLKRKNKAYRMHYPFQYENQLRKFIHTYNSRIANIFISWFNSKKDLWKEQIKRLDSWETELERFLSSFENDISNIIEDPTSVGIDVNKFVDKFYILVYTFNKNEFMQEMEILLGESFYGSEHWWQTLKQEWANIFKERTAKVTHGYVEKIRDIVYKGIQKNEAYPSIVKKIQKAGTTFTEAKANFIAKDLIGTLNSKLQKNMNFSMGITHYTWQTMADERVRGRPGGLYSKAIPSHWKMEGKICLWDDPTVYSVDGIAWTPRNSQMPLVHPGMEWLCRCIPVAYFMPLIDELRV